MDLHDGRSRPLPLLIPSPHLQALLSLYRRPKGRRRAFRRDLGQHALDPVNLVLERCAIEPLERGWITDGNIEKFDEVAGALKRLIKKSGSKTKNVAMALPPSAVAGALSGVAAMATMSNSSLLAPQAGQHQSSGMSSQRVPAAIPSSGQPFASS